MKKLITAILLLISTVVVAQETITIGSQVWMKSNLNVGIMIPNTQPQSNPNIIEKWCYNNSESNCNKFGALYQYSEAMQPNICPNGFRVPTFSDWETLIAFAGGTELASKELNIAVPGYWIPIYTQTNSTGFSAVGNGYGKPTGFGLLGSASYWWTTSSAPINTLEWYKENYPNVTTVCPIYITGNYYPAIKANPYDINKKWAMGIRCIKN